MITTQFALSILLIVATIVVNKQVHYLATKDLGFDKDQVAVIQLANTNIDLNHKNAAFVNALKQNPGVVCVRHWWFAPGLEDDLPENGSK